MESPLIFPKNKKLIVLISFLDWGLGHTTRCIPIIHEFINQGFSVKIAATPTQISLLKQEIAGAEFYTLLGYDIHYSRKEKLFSLGIIFQLPKILRAIYKEHQWIKSFCKQNEVHLIFSDNRPGFRLKNIPSIYLTHQLTIKTGNRITSKIASYIHSLVIKRFNECWIPDADFPNLSGELSHQKTYLISKKYIGPLSRFEHLAINKERDITIILSGPEPQRTVFENIILKQIHSIKQKVLLVRGLPGTDHELKNLPFNISVKNHLNAEELNREICSSKIIISRSGYTTVMDLTKTGSRAILVPTPGQGEQEYLATYLEQKKYFKSVSQHNFSLSKYVDELNQEDFVSPELDFELHKIFISDLKHSLTLKYMNKGK